MGNEDVWESRAAMLLNEYRVLLHWNWKVAGMLSSRWCDQWSYSNSTAMEEAWVIWSQFVWDVWDYRALVSASPAEWAEGAQWGCWKPLESHLWASKAVVDIEWCLGQCCVITFALGAQGPEELLVECGKAVSGWGWDALYKPFWNKYLLLIRHFNTLAINSETLSISIANKLQYRS